MADRAAEIVITVGGLSVIAAVLGIILYLGSVTLPLLAPGSAAVEQTSPTAAERLPLDVLVDEYQTFAVGLSRAGTFDVIDLGTGELIQSRPIAQVSVPLRAGRFDLAHGRFAAATDSRIMLGSVGFAVRMLSPATVPGPALDIAIGSRVRDGAGIIERIDRDQWRHVEFRAEVEVQADAPGTPLFVDDAPTRSGRVTAVWLEDGSGAVVIQRRGGSMMDEGGGASLAWSELPSRESGSPVVGMHLIDDAKRLVLIGRDGRIDRYRIGRRDVIAEATERIAPQGSAVAATGTVLGRRTIVLGTESGDVHTAYLATDADENTTFVPVHRAQVMEGPIAAIRSGLRDRTVFIGGEDGSLTAWHATSDKTVFEVSLESPGVVGAIGVAPKLDGVVAFTPDALHRLSLDVGHPEATVRSLFLPVRYEGQAGAEYVYQASAAEDDAEPKLSLVPLIFGTIKATVVSMLFAAPLAVLAAIFTSEFMEERARRYIKPGVEMMASLPSVVLGFLAAMVVAPFLRDHLMAVLLSFVTMPLAVVTVAATWTAIGDRQIRRLGASGTLVLSSLIAVAGIGMAIAAAPHVERALFHPTDGELSVLSGLASPVEADMAGAVELLGEHYSLREPTDEQERARFDAVAAEFATPNASLKGWLGGVIGGPEPGWFAITLPIASLLIGTVGWSVLNGVTGRGRGRLDPLIRLVVAVVLGSLAAWAVAEIMAGLEFDLRDSLLGTYTQRNTLVVGMIMGLAIIPIIYTISDDAMRSVPVSLKAASLGAGATPWQTVVRVVLPVAASGIFSAVMIGLGRAVGETMIVLMATGNTPVMEWNLFSGLRTLSANIAVELPEADRGSTHYRLLFLCGVVLFVMTFVINTTAELVRQRFRRRNALL